MTITVPFETNIKNGQNSEFNLNFDDEILNIKLTDYKTEINSVSTTFEYKEFAYIWSETGYDPIHVTWLPWRQTNREWGDDAINPFNNEEDPINPGFYSYYNSRYYGRYQWRYF